MTRESFYNDRRKERKIDFLADIRVVRKYFCRKHDLQPGDFEFLCKLHQIDKFIYKDFEENEYTLCWNKHRWDDLKAKDWIVVWRDRKPSEGRNYKIYTISRKAKRMIDDCYKILCGELPIPEETRINPIMKEESYNDKRYAKAIRMFNAARNKKD